MSVPASADRVGLVFVSHSAKIAAGLVELARQMAPTVRLVAAGGTDEGAIGTSFDMITTALAEADGGAGVVILCDLGSAILTAETARDFLDQAEQDQVRIVDAPLVEGGVAAAVAAEIGGDLDAVVAAARTALQAAYAGELSADAGSADPAEAGEISRTVILVNRDGLHARPAAEFVTLASTFAVPLTVNGTDATSLLSIMSLGLARGSSVHLASTDPAAGPAISALAALLESGFGEA
ncbi:dihydroxyacetone kinase phosphoryl donor subunit DhaM [Cryobacterium sp. TMS1-13-1]|uniref:dihydroxyacetone kinase phosphoryl donor subunit DhaM n=1 Tax=Cryobacterium sp. TMS1-13-1 TaxID=1259220 RepID=UPI00106CA76D|nr:dihydroxyacetone kinase phosphoryl donor subunit DhaM [Cryobacterium sp. TMS1-13-1]TFD21471.1 HPr family phosphocarrier protein [Cryobacterium sp. TMS1-13-1]